MRLNVKEMFSGGQSKTAFVFDYSNRSVFVVLSMQSPHLCVGVNESNVIVVVQ